MFRYAGNGAVWFPLAIARFEMIYKITITKLRRSPWQWVARISGYEVARGEAVSEREAWEAATDATRLHRHAEAWDNDPATVAEREGV